MQCLTTKDFDKAWEMQQSLKPLEFELDEDENENEADLIQKLIENAMPERKKVKKTQDVDM